MPTFDQDEITRIIEQTLDKMYATEEFLLENDVSDHCLVTVFRDYLLKEHAFDGYSVDVEYNRKEYVPKDMAVLIDRYEAELKVAMPLKYSKMRIYAKMVC